MERNIYKIGKELFITSDEEIKDARPHKGKWHLEEGQILNKFPDYLTDLSECKLVIMTTDPKLIADGVQAIPDEFLEWFVKNPSCERVEVKKGFADGSAYGYDFLSYKIIIPKEEPIRKIDTCYNFDMKIGCVQDICRCEQEVYDRAYQPISLSEVDKEEPKQETLEERKWLSIFKEYTKDGESNLFMFFNWLEINYNPPTKK
jgi:hypothetical protein